MSILMHPNAELEYFGHRYDFDVKGIRASGRSEIQLADAISRIATEFDCFLINRNRDATSIGQAVITAVARCVSGWVEVFGTEAEKIHDAVDQASVKIGRQKVVGEGIPMTVWNAAMDDFEIAQHILSGGQGTSALRVVIYLATMNEEEFFFERLKVYLAKKSP